MNMTYLVIYVSSYSESQYYDNIPRKSCMQKCLIVVTATKTFSIQINGFLPKSEDKEKMELDIPCRCIVTGWQAMDTSWEMENSDSVLGKKITMSG